MMNGTVKWIIGKFTSFELHNASILKIVKEKYIDVILIMTTCATMVASFS